MARRRSGFFDMFMDSVTGAPKSTSKSVAKPKPKYEWVLERKYRDPSMKEVGADPGVWVKRRVK